MSPISPKPSTKVILFLVVPAAFMDAVPAGFVKGFSWSTLGLMLLGAAGFLMLATLVFHAGLRRYESGRSNQT
jgi:ABC-type uncharacterized transport system permease subunit